MIFSIVTEWEFRNNRWSCSKFFLANINQFLSSLYKSKLVSQSNNRIFSVTLSYTLSSNVSFSFFFFFIIKKRSLNSSTCRVEGHDRPGDSFWLRFQLLLLAPINFDSTASDISTDKIQHMIYPLWLDSLNGLPWDFLHATIAAFKVFLVKSRIECFIWF